MSRAMMWPFSWDCRLKSTESKLWESALPVYNNSWAGVCTSYGDTDGSQRSPCWSRSGREAVHAKSTLLSFQGIGRSHLSICSRTRHPCRSVRKRVSPRRSWNSSSSLSPRRGARCGISPAWGIKCASTRSAHFLLRWPSKTFWLIGPNSLIRDGFQ